MDMVDVCSNFLKFDVVPFAYLLRDFYYRERDFIREQTLSILDGKDDVVVRVVRIVEGLDWTHPSIVAETKGFRTFLYGTARQSRGENKFYPLVCMDIGWFLEISVHQAI